MIHYITSSERVKVKCIMDWKDYKGSDSGLVNGIIVAFEETEKIHKNTRRVHKKTELLL
jgi:hypothetical protein